MIPLAAWGLALVAPAAGTLALVTTFVATFVAVALITAVSLAPSFLLFPLENSPLEDIEDIEAMRQAELDAQVITYVRAEVRPNPHFFRASILCVSRVYEALVPRVVRSMSFSHV